MKLEHDKGYYNSSRSDKLSFQFEIQVSFDIEGRMTWHVWVHVDEIPLSYYRRYINISARGMLILTIRALKTHLKAEYGEIHILKETMQDLLDNNIYAYEILDTATTKQIEKDSNLTSKEYLLLMKKINEK